MNKRDIEKLMTEKVSVYISRGYAINIDNIGGCQSDWHIDLLKGDDLVRISIARSVDRNSRCMDGRTEIVSLVTEAGKISYRPDLTEIERLEWYNISRSYGRMWLVDEDGVTHAEKIREKRISDFVRRYGETRTEVDSCKVIKLLVAAIRHHKGYGKIKMDDVNAVFKFTSHEDGRSFYHVSIKDKHHVSVYPGRVVTY